MNAAVGATAAIDQFFQQYTSSHRLTGNSISFNLGVGVIGGATPMLATWAIKAIGSSLAPAWLMNEGAAVAAATLLWMRDQSREHLR